MGGLSQLGVRAANAVLFVLCAFLTAGVVNDVAGDLLAPSRTVAAPPAPRTPLVRRAWSDRAPILDRNLFGAQLAGEAPPEPEPEEKLEQTRLPLRLLGTAAAGDPELSSAAIEDKGSKKHEVVRVGDRLEKHKQVRVVGIERRRVILENRGRREELALDEETTLSTTPRRTAARRTPPRTRTRPESRMSDRLKALRERAEANTPEETRSAASLFSEARILPKYEDGEMVGITLSAIKSGSMYERFGFKDGDVITELNGITIDNPSASARLLSELSQADSFEFTVNGEKRVIPSDQVDEVLDQL